MNGTICTNPAMCYISVRPERHSYPIIASTMEFTINLTTESMAHATDLCGVKSGRDIDKWEVTGLTKGKGVNVSCPYIVESPLSIECRVKEIMHLGSHDMMIAEVLGVLADDSLLDPSTGAFDLGQAGLINYSHGHYYRQGEEIEYGLAGLSKEMTAIALLVTVALLVGTATMYVRSQRRLHESEQQRVRLEERLRLATTAAEEERCRRDEDAERFRHIASDIMAAQASDMRHRNEERLQQVLAPLKADIERFKRHRGTMLCR